MPKLTRQTGDGGDEGFNAQVFALLLGLSKTLGTLLATLTAIDSRMNDIENRMTNIDKHLAVQQAKASGETPTGQTEPKEAAEAKVIAVGLQRVRDFLCSPAGDYLLKVLMVTALSLNFLPEGCRVVAAAIQPTGAEVPNVPAPGTPTSIPASR